MSTDVLNASARPAGEAEDHDSPATWIWFVTVAAAAVVLAVLSSPI